MKRVNQLGHVPSLDPGSLSNIDRLYILDFLCTLQDPLVKLIETSTYILFQARHRLACTHFHTNQTQYFKLLQRASTMNDYIFLHYAETLIRDD